VDYMSSIPLTKHENDRVFMVIDQFSNMVALAPCKKSIIVEITSNILFEFFGFIFGSHEPLF
jgi:hypothetical protein